MRIAIISDIHDSLTNLKKCLKWCNKNKITSLVCCGDITNESTLKCLIENYANNIYLVQGNGETYPKEMLKKYSHIKFYDYIGMVNLKNQKIGFCHEPFRIADLFAQINSQKNNYDIIFYGHTHKPWESFENNTKLVNPGTLGGVYYRATFAIYNLENKKLELKMLDEI
jgi:putative phosphoesterase